MIKFFILIIFLLSSFFFPNIAHADSIQSCNAILRDGLYNKLIKSEINNSHIIYEQELYYMSEEEAYQQYLDEVSNARKGGGGIGVQFPIPELPIAVNASGEKTKVLSRKEFSEELQKWKNEEGSRIKLNARIATDTKLTSLVKDKTTIKAWRDCVILISQGSGNGIKMNAYFLDNKYDRIVVRVIYDKGPGMIATEERVGVIRLDKNLKYGCKAKTTYNDKGIKDAPCRLTRALSKGGKMLKDEVPILEHLLIKRPSQLCKYNPYVVTLDTETYGTLQATATLPTQVCIPSISAIK